MSASSRAKRYWTAGAIAFGVGLIAFQLPRSAEYRNAEKIEDAIGLYITPRGQTYFHKNLEDVLFRNGYSLSEGAFAGFKYTAKEPLRLDELSPRMKQFGGTFAQIRDTLTRWLSGFRLNDPRLQASLQNISYSMKFTRLGISVDQKAARALGHDDGIVLNLEMEIPQLKVQVARVRATDLNNDFLGEFGINQFWLGLRSDSVPLKVLMPFLVDSDSQGKLRIQALDLKTNLASVQLETGFDRPLVLPRVEVSINNHSMVLDQSALEKDLLSHQNKLLKALQNYIKETTEEQVPERLNALFADLVDNNLGEVNEMDPVGLDRVGPNDKFKWGIIPTTFEASPRFLHIGTTAFVEDPRAKGEALLPARVRAPGKARLTALDPSQYDIAIAVNQGLLNRVLQLSFNRGYFNRVQTTSGDYIRLVRMPELRFDRATDSLHPKLHVVFRKDADGLAERVALHGGINMEFDMTLRIEQGQHGPKIVVQGIDTSTVRVDTRTIRMFKGTVLEKVRKSIEQANDWYRTHEEALMDNLPIPPGVLGIPIRVKEMRAESTGYLVLYLEYGDANELK